MLASQRTRLLERGHAQMAAFDPAEILPAGAGTPIACVTGAFRKLGESLIPGGLLPDWDLAFRVARNLFATPPALGNLLQWRLPGETPYRGTARIERILDRPGVPYLVIACVNANK
jgi:hypothetical protein